jgi:hypothetical protein
MKRASWSSVQHTRDICAGFVQHPHNIRVTFAWHPRNIRTTLRGYGFLLLLRPSPEAGGFARVSAKPWRAKGWHSAGLCSLLSAIVKNQSKFPIGPLFYSIFCRFIAVPVIALPPRFCCSENWFQRRSDLAATIGRHCITRNARDVTGSSRIRNGHTMDGSATIKHAWHHSGLARSIFVISEVMTSFADSVADWRDQRLDHEQ